MSISVEILSRRLLESGRDYICETILPAESARVVFFGGFQGQRVCWQMTLATLSHYKQGVANEIGMVRRAYRCPFIEIGAGVEGVCSIAVGLVLPEIDEPAIKKTIIMIRNYKRLRVGLIEFCPDPLEIAV